MNVWSKIGQMIDEIENINSDYFIGTQSRYTRDRLIGHIISILMENEKGIAALDIAKALGVRRYWINSILYKMAEYDICKRDSRYLWTLV